jgi:hypothetical protein
MKKNRLKKVIFILLLCLQPAFLVHAAEGGSGVYAPGFISPQSGFMPEPGTYFNYNLYAYDGDARANLSASRRVNVPGTNLVLPIQVNGSIEPDLDITGHLFTFTHVFQNKLLGANPGLGLTLTYINADLDISANGTISLTGPLGRNTLSIPSNGKASPDDKGIGDSVLTGLLGWHDSRMHYIAMLNIYVPTGEYDVNKPVNVGKNHWAIEPMGAFTYLNEKNGRELSFNTGITFNFENSDTDYKTGSELHYDIAAIQHLSEKFYLGLVGYGYHQLSGDSGSGAINDFKGRVYGWGPIIGGILPIGEKHKLYINARYYYELEAMNRLEGNTLFITGAVNF